ncbi:hypothetical protein BGW38_009392, partial [Lunasporangiospora selenospora]
GGSAPIDPDPSQSAATVMDRIGQELIGDHLETIQKMQTYLDQKHSDEKEASKMREDMRLNDGMIGLKGEVGDLKGEVGELKGEMKDLKGEATDIKRRLTGLQEEMSDVRDDVRAILAAL